MKQFLIDYFNNSEIDIALTQILNKKRIYLINDRFFAKIFLNAEDNNFENLKLEINLYLENNNVFNNIYIDSLMTDQFCILILKKIEGKALSTYRNNFNIRYDSIGYWWCMFFIFVLFSVERCKSYCYRFE